MENRIANDKERAVYKYLVEYTEKNLFPPTVGEIKRGCSLSSNSIAYAILGRLEKQGLILIKRNASRGIHLKGYALVKIEE